MGVAHHPQVDDIEHVDPQVAQVVANRLRQLGRALRRLPRRIRTAPTFVTIVRSSG